VKRNGVVGSGARRWASVPELAWRRATAGRRALPAFIIVGAQRGGTSSLYSWLCTVPTVTPARRKELHYFDLRYGEGERWYRAHFPLARPGHLTGEASPYMLLHPLAPVRAGHDLPASTRFIVVLRDPVERAVSHYWHERRMKAETEPLPVALALEEKRLAGQFDRVAAGGDSFDYFHFSYATRGRYAEQLRRWFEHVERERLLVVESETLFADPGAPGRVAQWLGLPPASGPLPALNEARRVGPANVGAVARLESYFEPHNEELFELLGYRLWGK